MCINPCGRPANGKGRKNRPSTKNTQNKNKERAISKQAQIGMLYYIYIYIYVFIYLFMFLHIFIHFEKHFKTNTRMTCSATKMRYPWRSYSCLTCRFFLNWTAEKTLSQTRFGTSSSPFWSWTTELRFDDFLNQESTNVSKNMHISDSLEKSTRPSSKYIAVIYK